MCHILPNNQLIHFCIAVQLINKTADSLHNSSSQEHNVTEAVSCSCNIQLYNPAISSILVTMYSTKTSQVNSRFSWKYWYQDQGFHGCRNDSQYLHRIPVAVVAWCCGQLWVWHMVCGRTCDGLYRFAFYLVNFGIPLGSHSEIDQIHLSSEAQCVSHHLPLVDCHKSQVATFHHWPRNRSSPKNWLMK